MTKHPKKLSKIYRKLIKGTDRMSYRSYRAGKKWKLADNQEELSKYFKYPFDGKKFYCVQGRKILSSEGPGKSWSVVSEIPAKLQTANLALYRISADRTAWCVYGESDANILAQNRIYLSLDDLKTFQPVVKDQERYSGASFAKLAVTPKGHILIGLHFDCYGDEETEVIKSKNNGRTWTRSTDEYGQLRSYESVASLGRDLYKIGLSSENDYLSPNEEHHESSTDLYILSDGWEDTNLPWNTWMQLYSDVKNKRMIGVGKLGMFETFDRLKWKPLTNQFYANKFNGTKKFELRRGFLNVQNILIADSGLMVIKSKEISGGCASFTYWVSTADSVRIAKHSAIVEEGLGCAGVPDDVIRKSINPFLFPQQ